MVAKKPVSALDSQILKLRELANELEIAGVGSDLNAAKRARASLDQVTTQLSAIAATLDPVWRPASVFDPTDPKTAGRVVALTLVAQDRHPLAVIPEFYGAGVYAIYYRGAFEDYAPLANTDHPIYVGKADPENPAAKDPIAQGTKLSARLKEHAKSIGRATTTLDLSDFDCRFLIVQTGFQKSAEDYLISFFKPIWNSETKICFGLGKHGDSSTTRANKRSPWDTMHPGRSWADTTHGNQKSPELIRAQIKDHLGVHAPYSDIHEIFDRFVSDIRQLKSDHFRTPKSVELTLPESPAPTPSQESSKNQISLGLGASR